MTSYDVIKIRKKLLKIEFLTDLANWYIKLMGLVRGFQIIFTFCSPTIMTSPMTSSVIMTSYKFQWEDSKSYLFFVLRPIWRHLWRHQWLWRHTNFKELLKIELLADLDDQYIKLTGMMRGFQNMFTFCIPTSVTSSMTSQSF